jgi:hypothetical protein
MDEDNSKGCSPDMEDIHRGEESGLSEDSNETPGPAGETEGKEQVDFRKPPVKMLPSS